MPVPTLNPATLNRWIIPICGSLLLLAVLFFLFQYNTGDSSLNSPLGIALWQTWINADPNAPDHSYCLFVPVMLAYLIWVKKEQIRQYAAAGDTWGIAAICIGLVLFWIGSRAGKQYVGCIGIQIIVAGLIVWFWGAALFRKLIFPWTIIAFAWPLPFLDTAVAFPLRMIVSHSAKIVLNLIGIATIQSGTALFSAPAAGTPEGAKFQIDIADPCSGLHSLLPLLMFSAFYCYFFLSKRWHQWTVFVSAFIFTIAGNVVRILMLVIGCLLFGSTFAIGTNDEPSWYHEGCGFVVFVIVLGLECLLGHFLVRWSGAKMAPAKTEPHASDSSPALPAPWRGGTIFGLTALMLGVFFVTPPVYLPSEAGVLMSLPEEVSVPGIDGGHFLGDPAAVSDAEHRMLPKDTEFERKNYSDYHEHNIFFSIVLSGVQQYTIHPPEICLVAQGWNIAGQDDVPITLQSGHKLIVKNLHLQRDVVDANNVHRIIKAYYMYWYVAEGLTTSSHLERNWISSWDRVVHNRDHRWAYVIAMSAITDSFMQNGQNEQQTRDMLANFIRQIVPTFQKNELTTATAASL